MMKTHLYWSKFLPILTSLHPSPVVIEHIFLSLRDLNTLMCYVRRRGKHQIHHEHPEFEGFPVSPVSCNTLGEHQHLASPVQTFNSMVWVSVDFLWNILTYTWCYLPFYKHRSSWTIIFHHILQISGHLLDVYLLQTSNNIHKHCFLDWSCDLNKN